MKKFTAAFLTILCLFAFAHTGAAQTIKLGTLAPEGSPWHTVLRDMAEEWKEISDGGIRVRIYPGGVAGDDADMVRKMRIGQLHAAGLTAEGMSNILEDLRVFQTPMLLRSNEELEYVRARLNARFEAAIEEKGFKVLYWSEAGWVYLFSNQKVVTPEDAKKLKIWVWGGDAAWTDAMKDAGYQPVPLPATEIHSGLQSGLIDAFSTTPLAALSFQWFGQAKHMLAMRWGPLTAAVVISKRTWDRIPDDQKPLIQAAAQKAGDAAKQEIRQLEVDAIEAMKSYGLEVHEVTPEIAADWQQVISETHPKLLGSSIPAEIYGEISAILEEYRAGPGAE